jgi:hypothetical protein
VLFTGQYGRMECYEEFVMAVDRNKDDRSGGQYMVQDSDHMSQSRPAPDKAKRTGSRQTEQSQVGGRQQGGNDHGNSRQQGGERRRQSH